MPSRPAVSTDATTENLDHPVLGSLWMGHRCRVRCRARAERLFPGRWILPTQLLTVATQDDTVVDVTAQLTLGDSQTIPRRLLFAGAVCVRISVRRSRTTPHRTGGSTRARDVSGRRGQVRGVAVAPDAVARRDTQIDVAQKIH